MNPGPTEEAGQTARTFIEALKGQPAVLALSIANFALLAFIFYALQQAATFRQKLLDQVFQNGKEINQLIASCRMGQQEEIPTPQPKPLHFITEINQAGKLQGWLCTGGYH
jgi:hypothetical protein